MCTHSVDVWSPPKKKKMALLLEITKLNKYDPDKCTQMRLSNTATESNFVEIEPMPKRLRTEGDIKAQSKTE